MEKIKKASLIGAYFIMALNLMTIVSLSLPGAENDPVGRLVSQSSICLRCDGNTAVAVTFAGTGRSEVMSEEDYLLGIVASQMPPEYDDEAIRAQTVASYTLIKYRRLHGIPDEEQSFLTKEQMKERWGKDYAAIFFRFRTLVDSVYGECITYDGEPVLAAYHAISCGVTESGGNIWKGDYPYLAPVSSRDDICAEDYRSTVRLTAERFYDLCGEKLGISTAVKSGDPVGEIVRSDSGYVLSCCLCDGKVTGQQVRNAFGLRSACFTLKYEDNAFVFDVRGNGHGAGMSQFGANMLALSGKSYREILAYYYQGTDINVEISG